MDFTFDGIKHIYHKMSDNVGAVFTNVFPCALKWFYRAHFQKTIIPYPIYINHIKVAVLYLHGKLARKMHKDTSAVLLLHGLKGHPFTMLHLADIASKNGDEPVFSLHLKYHAHHPELHRPAIKKAIDEIEQILIRHGSYLNKLFVVGHSQGAIEAAYRAFVEDDHRIGSVISIAGRLRVIAPLNHHLSENFKQMLEHIHEGIKSKLYIPLYQIVGKRDWNANIEATVIRSHSDFCHIVENGMHLNVLYHPETRRKFAEFLTSSKSALK